MPRPVVTAEDLVGVLRDRSSVRRSDVDRWLADESISKEAMVHAAAWLTAVAEKAGISLQAALLAAFRYGWDSHQALRGERVNRYGPDGVDVDELVVERARELQRVLAEWLSVAELDEDDDIVLTVRAACWSVYEAIRRRDKTVPA